MRTNFHSTALQTTIPERRPPSLGEVWSEETSLAAAPMPLPPHDGGLLSDWPAMAIPPVKVTRRVKLSAKNRENLY